MALAVKKADIDSAKKTHGKRYAESLSKIRGAAATRDAAVSYKQAFDLLVATPHAKFDETVDVAFRLDVDPKQADQMVRGAVALPHGLGKSAVVVVFAKGEKAAEAQKAGADFVGAEDLVEKINGGWQEFSAVVATPDMMGVVSRLGRVLGPRGLMPNPKVGTVTFELSRTIDELKKGRVEFRVEKAGVIHAPIGKMSLGTEKLIENFLSLTNSIVKARPSSLKGGYIQSIYLSSCMGPSIRISHGEFIEETA